MLAQIGLPIALAVIMFSMGLALGLEDFKRVKDFPKAFIVGLILQMILLPATAFILCLAWQNFTPTEPAILVGLVLIAACPGGVTSNLLSHLAKGDTALSISFTAIISLLSVFSIPFLVNLGLQFFTEQNEIVELSLGKVVVGIFVITTLPTALGMLVKKLKPNLAIKIELLVKKIAGILFIVIVTAAIFKEWSLIENNFQSIGPLVVFLNLLTMACAIITSKALKLKERQKRSIVFECGLQNGTLAITVAVTFLNNEIMIIPGALYSIFMFISGGAYLYYCLKKTTPSSDTI